MPLGIQKASMWKRASAYLFDFILLVTLAVLTAMGLSSVFGYNQKNAELDAYYVKYEQQFGIDFNNYEDYEKNKEAYEQAVDALNHDQGAIEALGDVITLTLVIVTLGILIPYAILEFMVPLMFGNGQTFGKKAFSLGVVRTDSIRVSPMLMFIRTFLGKYTIETMVPTLICILILFNQIGQVGMLVLGGLLALQVIVMIATSTNSAIHDLLAKTAVVDMPSQMIFDSEDELVAYKAQKASDEARWENY